MSAALCAVAGGAAFGRIFPFEVIRNTRAQNEDEFVLYEKPRPTQALIILPQRPQNFVPKA
jgi:hypothetical protein